MSDGGPPPPTEQDELARSARVVGLWLIGAVLAVVAIVLIVRSTLDDDTGAAAGGPTTKPAPGSDSGSAAGSPSASASASGSTASTGASTASSGATAAGPSSTVSSTTRTSEPVKVGFVNQEALVGSFPDVRTAAERAVTYVNETLGGVDGRPLQLLVCTTDSSAARSQACAAELVRQQVVAVTLGVDFGSPGLYQTLADAGIPVVGGVPRLLDDYRAPNGHFFVGGSVVTLPALADYATRVLGATRVTIVHRDVAATAAAARTLLVTPLQAAGAAADVVTVPNQGTPRPRIGPAGAVIVLADADDCAALTRAVRAAVPGVPILLPSSCGAVTAVAGLGIDGPLYVPSELVDPTVAAPAFEARLSTDLARYRQAMGADPSGGFAPVAFAAVVNVQQLLATAAEPTAAALTQALAAGTDRPGFLGHSYDCGAPHLTTLAPAVCQSAALVYGVGAGATEVPTAWTDGSALVS